jgi:hypothetical protein
MTSLSSEVKPFTSVQVMRGHPTAHAIDRVSRVLALGRDATARCGPGGGACPLTSQGLPPILANGSNP